MACAILAPVAWEPVKNRPSMSCACNAAPTSPAPTMSTKMSCGTPASCIRRAIAWPVMTAYSEGLYNTALPVSRAGMKTLPPTNQG